MTKIGQKRIHPVRTRGGNSKFRALRLDTGNFSWGSEAITRKSRIIDVVYNASNNELVRTKTLVKGCIVQIDATPFRQWWEAHYGQTLGKKAKKTETTEDAKKQSNHVERKIAARQGDAHVDPAVDDQFVAGRLYGTDLRVICFPILIFLACLSSRPGQSGRADGYILEGKELEFYLKKLRTKKSGAAQ